MIPDEHGWTVKRAGTERGQMFETQAEAIDAAKQTAKKENAELFIHSRDGLIRERSSYGA